MHKLKDVDPVLSCTDPPLHDSEKLAMLAQWFYAMYPHCDNDAVQKDLLRIARKVRGLEEAGNW